MSRRIARKSRRSLRLRQMLAFVPSLFSGQIAFAADFSFSPLFETNAQSLFGPGSAPISINKENQFLGARWGQADQGGPVGAEVSYGNYVNGNGFRLRGETSGRIGLEYGLKIDSGSIDAALPYDVRVTTPNSNTLTVGNKFTIDTAATFRTAEASFVSRSPTFQFYSDFIFETKARLSGQASADLFFFNKQASFNKQIMDVNVREEMIAINRDNDGGIRVLPLLFGAASTSREAYDNAQAAKDLKKEIDQTTGRREKVKVALKSMGVTFSLESPVEASVRLPYIEMSGQNVTRVGNKIRQSDKDGFAEFSFDLDRIAGIMFPTIVPPMTVNAELDFVVGSLESSATMLDVDFNPTLNLTQNAEVEGAGVNISFDFGKEVWAGVQNNSGSSTLAKVSSITMKAGEKLDIRYDGDDINLTPTYSADAKLNSQFGLSISSELQFKALMASVEAKLFGLELGGFSIGPAFQTGIQFPDVSLGNLFDKTFALGGFNSVEGAPVFISTKAAVFGGGVGASWGDASNWTVGTQPNSPPDIGRSATIPDNATVFSGSTNNAAYHVVIGRNATVVASGLSIGGSVYSQGTLSIQTNGLVNMEEDPVAEGRHTISGGSVRLGSGAQLVVKNNPATPAINSSLTLANTSVLLDSAGIYTQGGPSTLYLINGTSVVAGNSFANPNNLSVIGTKDAYGADIQKQGVQPVSISAISGANLAIEFGSMRTSFQNQSPTPAELLANTGPTDQMLQLSAQTGSTIKLKGSQLASNLNFRPIPGTIEGVRFTTAGTGQIRNVGAITLTASINDGNFVADAGDGIVGVSTSFIGQGSPTGENTPVVNNGTMTFISRAGKDSFIGSNNGAVGGTGEMQLIGYDNNYVKLGSTQGGTFLTNRSGHTIRADFANIGMNQLNLVNQGKVIVDFNIGAGRGDVTIDPSSTFVNEGTGVVQAKSGTLYLQGGSFSNFGTFEAFNAGVISSVTTPGNSANITNVTSTSSQVTLSGGKYRTEGSGRIYLNSVFSNTSKFINKAEIELYQHFGTPGTQGVFIRSTTDKNIVSYAEVENSLEGTFSLTAASIFSPTKFSNFGNVSLESSTITNVVNNTTGVVYGSGEVGLLSTFANFAENTGSIIAMDAGGFEQLTIRGGSGVNVIENRGLMAAIGGDLVFAPGLVVASSGAGAVSGGSWLVDGSTAPARIIVPTSTANLSAITFGRVTLKGAGARLDSKPTSGLLRDFQTTFTTVGTDGVLTLDNNTQTFTNKVTVAAGGQLLLANLGTVAGTGLDIAGTISGNGVINSPITMKGGRVEAKGGMLTIKKNIENRTTANSSSGTILAATAGAVLNPTDVRIDGGYLGITHYAAGLYGTGTIAVGTFNNQGVVAAGNTSLRLEGSGLYQNSNLITTRERGVLQLASMNLNNTGGTVSAVDTGGLDLQSDGGGIGGTVRLRSATINGGSVVISGANSKLDGIGTLNNVKISVNDATVLSDGIAFGAGVLAFQPASGSTALFYNSDVRARNGGVIRLQNGIFSASDSTLTAEDGSSFDLTGASLNNGKIVTAGSGVVRIINDSTMMNVKNTGRVDVASGGALSLFGTLDNRGGTLNNRGTLTMSDADLVGGAVNISSNGVLNATGRAQVLGSAVSNSGRISVATAGNLTFNQSNDGAAAAPSFNNTGTITTAGKLTILNQNFITSGNLEVTNTGSLVVQTLTQTGGTTRVNGLASVTNYYLQGGTLYGAGRITGRLTSTGGIIAPGNSPGTLTVEGDIVADSDTNFDMQIGDLSSFDRIVSETGDITLAGIINLDFTETDLETLGGMVGHTTTIDLFDVADGKSIVNAGVRFEFLGDVIGSVDAFNLQTGAVSFTVGLVPEPSSACLLLPIVGLLRRVRHTKLTGGAV